MQKNAPLPSRYSADMHGIPIGEPVPFRQKITPRLAPFPGTPAPHTVCRAFPQCHPPCSDGVFLPRLSAPSISFFSCEIIEK